MLKARIVRLDWSAWDIDAEPREYPKSGEPEDYILDRDHDEALSRQMGDFFEIVAKTHGTATIERLSMIPLVNRTTLVVPPGPLPAFFRAEGLASTFVNEACADFLLKHGGPGIALEQAVVEGYRG